MGRVPDSAQGPTGWFSTLAFYIRVVFNAANLQNYASSLEEKLWEASNANWTLQISTLNNYQESVFELFARIPLPSATIIHPPNAFFFIQLAACYFILLLLQMVQLCISSSSSWMQIGILLEFFISSMRSSGIFKFITKL